MGLTIVLSGSVNTRSQAVAALRQAGFEVEDSDDSHGFERDGGLSFITVHGSSIDAAAAAVSSFQWTLRSHWAATGKWTKVGGVGQPEPIAELEKLKAQLRAQGITLGE